VAGKCPDNAGSEPPTSVAQLGRQKRRGDLSAPAADALTDPGASSDVVVATLRGLAELAGGRVDGARLCLSLSLPAWVV